MSYLYDKLNSLQWEINKKVEAIIDESNDFYRSNIIGFEKVEDDYQTWLEKSQMEYDGEIKYPAIRKTYNEMMLVNLENV